MTFAPSSHQSACVAAPTALCQRTRASTPASRSVQDQPALQSVSVISPSAVAGGESSPVFHSKAA